MILCDASNPGTDSAGLYECPYSESVDGYRHGFLHEDGYGRSWVKWTRAANHPADPRCPECAARKATPCKP